MLFRSAVWGGVPRYWELRENRISLDDAMWHNILSVNGTLYEEPVKLFQDDVKDIVKTSTIMFISVLVQTVFPKLLHDAMNLQLICRVH